MKIRVELLSGPVDHLCQRLSRHALRGPVVAAATSADMPFGIAALMFDGRRTAMLALCQTSEPLAPRSVIPYHRWFNNQLKLTFWQAAFSWSLYRGAVIAGPTGEQPWTYPLHHPLPTDPGLDFLELTGGYVHWGFQLELLYRMADDDLTRAQRFRREWNAGRLDAREQAKALTMPDGASLAEVLVNRQSPPVWGLALPPPVQPAVLLTYGPAVAETRWR